MIFIWMCCFPRGQWSGQTLVVVVVVVLQICMYSVCLYIVHYYVTKCASFRLVCVVRLLTHTTVSQFLSFSYEVYSRMNLSELASGLFMAPWKTKGTDWYTCIWRLLRLNSIELSRIWLPTGSLYAFLRTVHVVLWVSVRSSKRGRRLSSSACVWTFRLLCIAAASSERAVVVWKIYAQKFFYSTNSLLLWFVWIAQIWRTTEEIFCRYFLQLSTHRRVSKLGKEELDLSTPSVHFENCVKNFESRVLLRVFTYLVLFTSSAWFCNVRAG